MKTGSDTPRTCLVISLTLSSFLPTGVQQESYTDFSLLQRYQNCSCFPTPLSEGIQGSGCEPECNSLGPFLFCLFGLMVFTFSNNIPATTATLRYVLEIMVTAMVKSFYFCAMKLLLGCSQW